MKFTGTSKRIFRRLRELLGGSHLALLRLWIHQGRRRMKGQRGGVGFWLFFLGKRTFYQYGSPYCFLGEGGSPTKVTAGKHQKRVQILGKITKGFDGCPTSNGSPGPGLCQIKIMEVPFGLLMNVLFSCFVRAWSLYVYYGVMNSTESGCSTSGFLFFCYMGMILKYVQTHFES